MNKARYFHSCYVVDLKLEGSTVTLKDSAKGVWNLNLANVELASQFKIWLEKIFLRGMPQTLTVFEYEDLSENETDFDFWLKKFHNLPS